MKFEVRMEMFLNKSYSGVVPLLLSVVLFCDNGRCSSVCWCTENLMFMQTALLLHSEWILSLQRHHIAPPRVTECWSIFYDGNFKLMKYYFMLSGKKGFFSSTLFKIVLHTRVRKGFQIAPSFSSSPPV